MCKVTSQPSLAKTATHTISKYFGEDGTKRQPISELPNILDTISGSFDPFEVDTNEAILLSKYLDIYKNPELLGISLQNIDRNELMQILETIRDNCQKISDRLTKYIEGIEDFSTTFIP